MKSKDIISIWKKISKVIEDEMTVNEEFAKKIEAILIPEMPTVAQKPKKKSKRNPSKINPIRLWEEGEERLQEKLAKLDLNELKDVVAEYGLDPKGSANRFRKREKLEELILEGAKRTATRGNAFWNAME